MSEEAKLLVAVSVYGRDALVVEAFGKLVLDALDNTGDSLDRSGPDERPEQPGLYAWEGRVSMEQPYATWTGTFRPLQAGEWDRLAGGMPLWSAR